jgi:hypothetical protein
MTPHREKMNGGKVRKGGKDSVSSAAEIYCKIREYRYIARNIPRTGEKMNKKWCGI